jgi:hypothetical protein
MKVEQRKPAQLARRLAKRLQTQVAPGKDIWRRETLHFCAARHVLWRTTISPNSRTLLSAWRMLPVGGRLK